MAKKLLPIIGSKVVRVCKTIHPVDFYDDIIIILLSGGYLIKLRPQDLYEYHDCDTSAKKVELEFDPMHWKRIKDDKEGYTDIAGDDVSPFT